MKAIGRLVGVKLADGVILSALPGFGEHVARLSTLHALKHVFGKCLNLIRFPARFEGFIVEVVSLLKHVVSRLEFTIRYK